MEVVILFFLYLFMIMCLSLCYERCVPIKEVGDSVSYVSILESWITHHDKRTHFQYGHNVWVIMKGGMWKQIVGNFIGNRI